MLGAGCGGVGVSLCSTSCPGCFVMCWGCVLLRVEEDNDDRGEESDGEGKAEEACAVAGRR